MCCGCTGDGDLQPHDFCAWSEPCQRKAGGDSSSGYGGLGASVFSVLRTVDTSEVPVVNPTLVFCS